MTQIAERHETYQQAFEAVRHGAAAGPDTLRRVREAAFARFNERGIPTTRDEEWRFTNLAPIAKTTFHAAPADVPVSASAIAPFLFGGAMPARAVVVNGRFDAALSHLGALPAGVTIRGLHEVLRSGDAARLGESLPASHAMVDLNTALFDDGVVIDVAPGTVVTEPLIVLFVAAPGGQARFQAPRLVITVGEHAEVSIIEAYAGIGAGTSFTNVVTDVRVEERAVVDHVKMQRESHDAYHLSGTFIHLARAATFRSTAMSLGARIARNDITATLDGEGAECTLNGLYVAGGDSLVDTHTTIDHAKAHCPSHEVYKGILTGRAHAVFNGKIIVRQDAQKTDAKQTNKALLLTDDAQINTKPQLEIFADDVKCTHGAAIGQLDEDALFYLRARGISAIDARDMLVHAFAGDVTDGIRHDAVREAALAAIAELLG